jgi:hypothetical protein
MLESLERRARGLAERQARRIGSDLAAALRESAPRGMRIEPRPDGVALAGRGLIRRRLIEPALRRMVERMRG